MDAARRSRWIAAVPSALRWAVWESETSVFNADTGETHLLSELPATALRLMCEHAWAFDALCAHLARLCETEDTAAWQQKIAQLLAGLEAVELIVGLPSETMDDGAEQRPAPA